MERSQYQWAKTSRWRIFLPHVGAQCQLKVRGSARRPWRRDFLWHTGGALGKYCHPQRRRCWREDQSPTIARRQSWHRLQQKPVAGSVYFPSRPPSRERKLYLTSTPKASASTANRLLYRPLTNLQFGLAYQSESQVESRGTAPETPARNLAWPACRSITAPKCATPFPKS